jgi:hypothetical protein
LYRAQSSRGAVIVWRQSSAATVPPDPSTYKRRRGSLVEARGQGRASQQEPLYGTTSAAGGTTVNPRHYGIQARGHGRAGVGRCFGTTETAPIVPVVPVEEFGGGWAAVIAPKRKKRAEAKPVESQRPPEPVAPVESPIDVPVEARKAVDARPQVDVVPMARAWIEQWAQDYALRLPPDAYAELLNLGAAAMLGVPRGTVQPVIDQFSLVAAAQQFEAARREDEDEALLLLL